MMPGMYPIDFAIISYAKKYLTKLDRIVPRVGSDKALQKDRIALDVASRIRRYRIGVTNWLNALLSIAKETRVLREPFFRRKPE